LFSNKCLKKWYHVQVISCSRSGADSNILVFPLPVYEANSRKTVETTAGFDGETAGTSKIVYRLAHMCVDCILIARISTNDL